MADDRGVALALAYVSQHMTPTGTRVDRTYVFPVDTATCGALGDDAAPHWCHGISDATTYSQAGEVRVRIRLTTETDLDADGVPDAEQAPTGDPMGASEGATP